MLRRQPSRIELKPEDKDEVRRVFRRTRDPSARSSSRPTPAAPDSVSTAKPDIPFPDPRSTRSRAKRTSASSRTTSRARTPTPWTTPTASSSTRASPRRKSASAWTA